MAKTIGELITEYVVQALTTGVPGVLVANQRIRPFERTELPAINVKMGVERVTYPTAMKRTAPIADRELHLMIRLEAVGDPPATDALRVLVIQTLMGDRSLGALAIGIDEVESQWEDEADSDETVGILTIDFGIRYITAASDASAMVYQGATGTVFGPAAIHESDVIGLVADLAARALTSYVDSQDAATLAAAEAYTDSHSSVLPTGSGNKFLATPADGSSGVTALRVQVVADVPALPESKITGLVADLTARALTTYVDSEDAATLAAAEAYTDSHATPLPTGSGNKILATPADGSSAVAALRAQVVADVPALPESKIIGLVADLASEAASRATGDIAAVTTAEGYTDTKIAALINSAPALLDTLKELADALGDDPNFATTMATALALKAPLASPALTGHPTGVTEATGDSSTRLATTALVDAKVTANAPGLAPVQSVAGRVGAVVLAEADVAGLVSDLALKAPLASPALTGAPTAPTAAALDNSTKLATTAYADAAVGVETARATAAEALKAKIDTVLSLSAPALLTAAQNVAFCNGTFTVTLPVVPDQTLAYTVIIGSGLVTIAPSSGTINGYPSIAGTAGYSFSLRYDGANWSIV